MTAPREQDFESMEEYYDALETYEENQDRRIKSYMTLCYHGGRCCGIKHIYCMGGKLDQKQPALKKMRNDRPRLDLTETSNAGRFFPHAAPRETSKNRLLRYLDWLFGYRKAGLVEIVLKDYQAGHWRSLLEDIGFKEVTKFRNSSTWGNVYVFHLKYNYANTPKPDMKEKFGYKKEGDLN